MKFFQAVRFLLVVLCVPVVLVMTSVRLLISPAYLVFAYNTPGFPDDPYGFTREERLHWGGMAVNYLVNNAGIEFLADQRFPPGQQAPPQSCQFMDDCTKLYNERELGHMVDVKNVVTAALRIWYVALAVLFVFGLWAWRGGWSAEYRRALSRGGWLTLFLLGGVILFVLLAFNVIFVLFHQVFFEAGTWTFYYSDTLIRMFPERFWQLTFLAVGGLSGGVGLLLGLFLPPRK